MTDRTPASRLLVSGILLGCVLLLLACTGGSPPSAGQTPRWACPSPTPRPWGAQGPIKDRIPLPTTTPDVPVEYEDVYYAEWEQEFPTPGLAVFPSPTPYAVVGTNYVLGQRVGIAPFHVLVTARDGPIVSEAGIPANTLQVFLVDITWLNAHTEAALIDYARAVQIRSVTAPDGAIVTNVGWGISERAVETAGLAWPPQTIPPGESRVSIPIIAPRGTVKSVALIFEGRPGTDAGTPGTNAATATPNAALQQDASSTLTVFWTDTALRIGPPCVDPGAITAWENGDGVSWGHEAALAIPAPPGAGRVVQIALNQVGKPYVWGAKGPETFDCSGLTTWSYARIGISIPQGTAGQWPQMRAVSQADLQPGDLIFFGVANPAHVDHVGMLIGDVDGDGTWDMVHASAPCCGVRVEHDVLNNRFWKPKIAGFRTAR